MEKVCGTCGAWEYEQEINGERWGWCRRLPDWRMRRGIWHCSLWIPKDADGEEADLPGMCD